MTDNLSFPSDNEPVNDEGGVESEETNGGDMIEPFDPTQIRVEPRSITVDLIMRRVEHGEIDLMPDFQRKAGLWKTDAQSRLIESLLIRIPLPAFYMDATNEDKWVVIDGLQRMTSLKRFIMDNTLVLHGMEFLTLFNNKRFSDLPRNFQRRILETQITLYLIERGTPPAVKFNIFKRINTGGLPLSSQEIRHALNQGPVTRLLAGLADSSVFKEATSYSIRDDRMADREFVLRWLSFYTTPFTEYKTADFDAFLNRKMSDLNEWAPEDLEVLKALFLQTMMNAHTILGDMAFRKRSTKPFSKRGLLPFPDLKTRSLCV